VKRQVEKTHKGLGWLTVFDVLCISARKCGIVIAPSGCGKSCVSDAVGEAFPQPKIRPDRIAVTGLMPYANTLSNSNVLIIVDDMAAMRTEWSRLHGTGTLAKLAYDHRYESTIRGDQYKIENFFGSVIINAQPDVYDCVISSPDFEGGIRDKTLRYYHLVRPWKPRVERFKLPRLELPDLKSVEKPSRESKYFRMLLGIARYCWGESRAVEHITDLLKASAALDGREKVRKIDYKIVYMVLRRMALEKDLIWKERFESSKRFNFWVLYLLTECVGRKRTVQEAALDYGISLDNMLILLSYASDYVTVENSPRFLKPTPRGERILREAGYL